MSIVIVLYFCFLRMDELEKVEMSLFCALCRNQRGEEAVNAKLQEIEKAEKKAEKKKAKQLRELEIKERKLKSAENKREREVERREKVLLRLAKRSIREARIFVRKICVLKLFVFCVRPWRTKLAEAGAGAGRRRWRTKLAEAGAGAGAGPRAAATTRPDAAPLETRRVDVVGQIFF